MSENRVHVPDEVKLLLVEMSRAIDTCLNGEPGTPKKYGFMLMVSPLVQATPVMVELHYNITFESMKTMLVETLGNIQGRLSSQEGHT